MTDKTTNEKIADLLYEQTYDERVEMAKYLSEAAQDWASEDNGGLTMIDADYFASLLGSWAESALEPEE